MSAARPIRTTDSDPSPAEQSPADGTLPGSSAPLEVAAAGGRRQVPAAPVPAEAGTGASAPKLRGADARRARTSALKAAGLSGLMDLGAVMKRNSRAQSTLEGYERVVADFIEVMGVAPCQADSEQVQIYLLGLAVQLSPDTGEVVYDEHGQMQRGQHVKTVIRALAAIDEACDRVGATRHGHGRDVKRLVAGIRRTFGVMSDCPRDPLFLPDLRLMLEFAVEPPMPALRAQVVALLHRLCGATAGQVHRLTGDDIAVTDTSVTVSLPPAGKGEPRRAATVSRAKAEGDLLAQLLEPLSSSRRGRQLLSDPCGRTVTRPHLYDVLDTTRESLGGWPNNRLLAIALKSRYPREGRLAFLRDRVLLLVGFFTALRRSNLSRLRLCDLERVKNGWRIRVGKEKNRQAPVSYRYITVPQHDDDAACPTAALDNWVAALAHGAGASHWSQLRSWPLLTTIDQHDVMGTRSDGTPRPMSGASINQRVQALAVRAGLMPAELAGDKAPFGSHSLRAGLITSLLTQGVAPSRIIDITGHSTIASLTVYDRPTADTVCTAVLLGPGATPPTRSRAVTVDELAAHRGRRRQPPS